MRLVATLPAPLARDLRAGLPATIRFTQPGEAERAGTVTDVVRFASDTEVIIESKQLPRAPLGTTANVEILLARCQNVVRIPVSSLVLWDTEAYCYLKANDGISQHPSSWGQLAPSMPRLSKACSPVTRLCTTRPRYKVDGRAMRIAGRRQAADIDRHTCHGSRVRRLHEPSRLSDLRAADRLAALPQRNLGVSDAGTP